MNDKELLEERVALLNILQEARIQALLMWRSRWWFWLIGQKSNLQKLILTLGP